MPEVVFLPKPEPDASAGTEALRADAPEGGSLGDLCDDVDAPVPFSCRGASCGTCRVIVFAGADLLYAPSAEEAETLGFFAPTAPPGAGPAPIQRLACQVRMREGPGCIIIRPVADDE